MTIYLGADHNGYEYKEKLEAYLKKRGHEVIDVGNQKHESGDDFPEYGALVASNVLADEGSVGVLLCGSGQGVCMAANRFRGIRASLVWNESEAKSSRNDDDSNVLCLPANEIAAFQYLANLVDTWLATPFAGSARFKRRIKQLDELN